MKKEKQAPAPVSLGGFFPDSDEEPAEFVNETELVEAKLGSVALSIRQMAWHGANANQIWPGTFSLVDYLLSNEKYKDAKLLELGSATGALALALIKAGGFQVTTRYHAQCNPSNWVLEEIRPVETVFSFVIKAVLITFPCPIPSSDIDDEGVVQENIEWNFKHNGCDPVLHIAHTWGTGWKQPSPLGIRFVVASDILLYVSAYDALVQTLCEIFEAETLLEEMVMSWNRRIAQSELFFQKMQAAGFAMSVVGSGLYTFCRPQR